MNHGASCSFNDRETGSSVKPGSPLTNAGNFRHRQLNYYFFFLLSENVASNVNYFTFKSGTFFTIRTAEYCMILYGNGFMGLESLIRFPT